jgi:ATP-binding cassette subfamily B protein
MIIISIIANLITTVLGTEIELQIATLLGADLSERNRLILIIFLIAAVDTLLLAVVRYTKNRSYDGMFTVLWNEYSDKILDGDYNMFTEFSCSRIITAESKIYNVAQIGQSLKGVIMSTSQVLVILVYVYRIYPKLLIPVAVIYLITACIIKYTWSFYAKIWSDTDKIRRKRNQETDEIVNAFNEVRSFNTQEKHHQSISSMSWQVNKLRGKKVATSNVVGTASCIAMYGSVLLVAIWSLNAVDKGELTVAFAMVLVSYMWQLIGPIENFFEMTDELTENLSQLDDYDKIMTYENKVDDRGPVNLNEFNDKIELKDVAFSYGESNNVLQNLNMTIKKGQHIGICGTSGGGKTTLIRLLEKFYVPSEGKITVDGIDMNLIDGNSLRKKIAVVHQDNHIFNASIYDNIIYGSETTKGPRSVLEACRKANLLDFIESLPDKFDTIVGPRGLKLSGGQKQRIALARIFLKDPEIILLDEATSALDNETESIVQEAIDAFQGKTVITVAHRLSTIRNSDIIYVIDNHKVAEAGTHDELIAADGIYAHMCK